MDQARRRLGSLARQLLSAGPVAAVPAPALAPQEIFGPQVGLFSSAWHSGGDAADVLGEARFKELFGPSAYIEGPLAQSGMGRRYHNVDLTKPFTPEQAAFVLDAFAHFGMVSFPGQDLDRFDLAHFERFSCYFGAPQPIASQKMMDDRSKVGTVFPGQLAHMPTSSPAILTITNVRPLRAGREARVQGPAVWHADQEYERLPCSCSMFLVHKVPTGKDSETGNWIRSWDREAKDQQKNYVPGASAELRRLRFESSPLNGETPFVDTAAAFAALPKDEQENLAKVYLHRFGDAKRDAKSGQAATMDGWLAPVVRTNPRSGVKSLHSPVYGNRLLSSNIPAVEIEGMTPQETQQFLDRLEEHVLQPHFRYDHPHRPGDVTVWSNFACLHNIPPQKLGIDSLEDARLFYRISCKGPPALTLPRPEDASWAFENFTIPYQTPKEILEAK